MTKFSVGSRLGKWGSGLMLAGLTLQLPALGQQNSSPVSPNHSNSVEKREVAAAAFKRAITPLRPQLTAMLNEGWEGAKSIKDPLLRLEVMAGIAGLQVRENAALLETRLIELRKEFDAIEPNLREKGESIVYIFLFVAKYNAEGNYSDSSVQLIVEQVMKQTRQGTRITMLRDIAAELNKKGKIKQARSLLNIALMEWREQREAKAEQEPYNNLHLAKTLADAQDFTAAWEVCEQITPALLPQAQVYLILAETRNGGETKAKERTAAVKNNKTLLWAHLARGRYWAQRHDKAAAKRELEQTATLKIAPELMGIYSLLLAQTDDFPAALQWAEKIKEQEQASETKPANQPTPDNEPSLLASGNLAKDVPEQNAMHLPQSYREVMFAMAKAAAISSDLDNCLAIVRKLKEREKRSLYTSELMELIDLRLKRQDLIGASRIVAFAPSAEAYITLAQFAMTHGDLLIAGVNLNKALELKGDKNRIAAMMVLTRNKKRAIEIANSFEDAIDAEKCRLAICVALRKTGDIAGCKELLDKCESRIHALPAADAQQRRDKYMMLGLLIVAQGYEGDGKAMFATLAKLPDFYLQSPALILSALYWYLQDPEANKAAAQKWLLNAKNLLGAKSIPEITKLLTKNYVDTPEKLKEDTLFGSERGTFASVEDAAQAMTVTALILIAYVQSLTENPKEAIATLEEVRTLKFRLNPKSIDGTPSIGSVLLEMKVSPQSLVAPLLLELLHYGLENIIPSDLAINDQLLSGLLGTAL